MDSLWSVAGSELRDWEVMTTCLLQDTGEKPDETVTHDKFIIIHWDVWFFATSFSLSLPRDYSSVEIQICIANLNS